MVHLVLAIVGVAALVVLVFFFRYFMAGAAGLFAWASHSGTKGIILYLVCWAFLSPLMVIGSVIYGYSLSQEGR